MRDNEGVPHPTTCGIFGTSKICTHLTPIEFQDSKNLISNTIDFINEQKVTD